MHCFNHPEKEALGTCKCCNKGICEDCLIDLGEGIACKGIHEDQVEAINLIIRKNAKAYAAAPKNAMIAPAFYLFMGLVFSGFGYFSRGGPYSLPFIMGAGFSVFAVVVFFRNRELFGDEKVKRH